MARFQPLRFKRYKLMNAICASCPLGGQVPYNPARGQVPLARGSKLFQLP